MYISYESVCRQTKLKIFILHEIAEIMEKNKHTTIT